MTLRPPNKNQEIPYSGNPIARVIDKNTNYSASLVFALAKASAKLFCGASLFNAA